MCVSVPRNNTLAIHSWQCLRSYLQITLAFLWLLPFLEIEERMSDTYNWAGLFDPAESNAAQDGRK